MTPASTATTGLRMASTIVGNYDENTGDLFSHGRDGDGQSIDQGVLGGNEICSCHRWFGPLANGLFLPREGGGGSRCL